MKIPVFVQILNALGLSINPATSEKQDQIITAIQNISTGGGSGTTGGATEATLAEMNSTIYWLKMLVRLLKPLSVVTGGGVNRLIVDVNNIIGTLSTVTTVTTVTTVASVTATQNQVNMGNVSAFTLQQSLTRNAFANSTRRNLV